MEHTTNKTEIIYSIILIGLFMLIIFLPIIDNIFHFTKDIKLKEKRTYEKMPKISLIKSNPSLYASNFEKFYDDHFGARALLIKTNSFIRYYFFKSSSVSDIIAGDNQWFYKDSYLNYSYFSDSFSEEQMRAFKSYLENASAFSKRNNITYIFVVVPGKEEVYPEYLPDNLKNLNQKNKTEQLIQYLRENSNLNILYLKEPLVNGKKINQTYYQADTHWNRFGSFIGYQEIAEELEKKNSKINPYNISNLEDLKFNEKKKRASMAEMLGLQEFIKDRFLLPRLNEEEEITFTEITKNVDGEIRGENIITNTNHPEKPNILLSGDSFLNNLEYFASPKANMAFYYINDQKTKINLKFLKENNITIIIDERNGPNFLKSGLSPLNASFNSNNLRAK